MFFLQELRDILIFYFNIISVKITHYNTLNVKLSNSQLNKLKSEIKKVVKVTLNLPSIADSNDKINFPNKLLSTDTQVLRPPKDFSNGSSVNIK